MRRGKVRDPENDPIVKLGPPIGKTNCIMMDDPTITAFPTFDPPTNARLVRPGEHIFETDAQMAFVMSRGRVHYDGGRLNGGAIILRKDEPMSVKLEDFAVMLETDANVSGIEFSGRFKAMDASVMQNYMKRSRSGARVITGYSYAPGTRQWAGSGWGFDSRDGRITIDSMVSRSDMLEFSVHNRDSREEAFHSYGSTTSAYISLESGPLMVTMRNGRLELVERDAPSVIVVGPKVPHLYIPRDALSYSVQLSSGRQIRTDSAVHELDLRTKENEGIAARIRELTGRPTRFG